MPVDFLTDEEVYIPKGQLRPRGMIAPWAAGVNYRIGWFENDLQSMGLPFDSRQYSSGTGKYRYYYSDYSVAAQMNSQLGRDTYPPEIVWRFVTNPLSVLNFSDESTREKFGDSVTFEVLVKSLQSLKHRHEFHLISLPYSVQAMALSFGYLQERIFDANELLTALFEVNARENPKEDHEVFTDTFFANLCGNPDDLRGWLDSELGKRRAELWNALGEPDPSVSSRDKTESEPMKHCLRVYQSVWGKPVFARVINLPDPKVDAAYDDASGNRKRPQIPAIYEIFDNEEQAREAAKQELDSSDTTPTSQTAPQNSNNDKPLLPASWADLGEAAFVENLKAVINDPPAKVATQMGISIPEANTWIEYLT